MAPRMPAALEGAPDSDLFMSGFACPSRRAHGRWPGGGIAGPDRWRCHAAAAAAGGHGAAAGAHAGHCPVPSGWIRIDFAAVGSVLNWAAEQQAQGRMVHFTCTAPAGGRAVQRDRHQRARASCRAKTDFCPHGVRVRLANGRLRLICAFHGTVPRHHHPQRPPPDGGRHPGCFGGDGQVTLGNIVVKGTARKVRKLHHGKVLAGFAGATADAFTLFERFEAKLEKHQGHLTRAAIELTKDWRTDRVLRRLEAMLAVADHSASLIITGNGDVLEPEEGIVAIGSGGAYALGRPRRCCQHRTGRRGHRAKKSLAIAGELCIYTNMHHTDRDLPAFR